MRKQSLVGTHKCRLIITQTAIIGLINAKVLVFPLCLITHIYHRSLGWKKNSTHKGSVRLLGLKVVENEEPPLKQP